MTSKKKTADVTKMELAESDDSESDVSDENDHQIDTAVEPEANEANSGSDDTSDDDDDSDDDDEMVSDQKERGGESLEMDSNSDTSPKKTDNEFQRSSIDQQYEDIRNEIADLPFEDLQKLKNKMGLKLFNRIYYGKEPKKALPIPKRANKNRPQEISSKKPPKVGKFAKIRRKPVICDPRFDERFGEFDEQQFKESYSFIEDIRDREKAKLQKLASKEKNPEKKQNVSYLLNRMNQQEDTKKMKEKSKELKRKIKRTEREDIVQGKTPYYLKKSDQKKLELAEKFRELKKSGKLDKFMSKKRKKLAQKDRKKMPSV